MFFDPMAFYLWKLASERHEGQGLAEYGMILVAASITVVVALFALTPRIEALFATVRSSIGG